MWTKISLLILILTVVPRSLVLILFIISVIALVVLYLPFLLYGLFWATALTIMYGPPMIVIFPAAFVC